MATTAEDDCFLKSPQIGFGRWQCVIATPLPVRRVLRPGRVPAQTGRERWRSGRKGRPVEGCTRRERLVVHLLEAKTFAAQFKNLVVVLFRAASRMSFGQLAQPDGELVAHANH